MHDFLLIHILELEQEAKINRKYRRWHLADARTLKREPLEGEKHKLNPAKSDWHYRNYHGMHNHNQTVVRSASRSAQLAYGFLKGNQYNDIEYSAKTMPNWKMVRIFAMRFYD